MTSPFFIRGRVEDPREGKQKNESQTKKYIFVKKSLLISPPLFLNKSLNFKKKNIARKKLVNIDYSTFPRG